MGSRIEQTAVEWLMEKLHTAKDPFTQAQAIEKRQIMQAWIDGMKSVSIAPFEDEFYQDEAERYYENR